MTRKLAESSTPTVEIKQEGDEYVIKTIAFKNSEIKFALGQEFEEKRLDGATVKVRKNCLGHVVILSVASKLILL